MFTDLMQSPPSVRPSVRPPVTLLLNPVTFDIDLIRVYGHDHSSPGIEGHYHQRSRSNLKSRPTINVYYLLIFIVEQTLV